MIRVCPSCGVKNALPLEGDPKRFSNPKCGKCGSHLFPPITSESGQRGFLKVIQQRLVLRERRFLKRIESLLRKAQKPKLWPQMRRLLRTDPRSKSQTAKQISIGYLKKLSALTAGALIIFYLNTRANAPFTNEITSEVQPITSANRLTSNSITRAEWREEIRDVFNNLSSSDRRRLQSWLANNFSYRGSFDGVWGPMTEASLMRAYTRYRGSASELIVIALSETPQTQATPQTTRQAPLTQSNREPSIHQLRLACQISPPGSVGAQMADNQLYILTGERCARAAPLPIPVAPFQSPQINGPTRCTQRVRPDYLRIPGMTYPLTFDCQ